MLIKKIVLFMSIIILIQVSITTYAVTDEQAHAANQLHILNIYRGYEDGTLRLDNNIKRSEMAALLVRMLGHENNILLGSEDYIFNDVTDDFWGKEYIQKSAYLDLFVGYPDKTFKPNKNIKYAEVITLMVRAVNKNEKIEGNWPDNYINKAKDLGIISYKNNTDPNKIVTRGEVALYLWNTLLVEN